jgi:Cu/Zn superoxide dismutase
MFHYLFSSATCSSPILQQPALLLKQSTPSNPTFHLLPAVYKAANNAQPLHIHPEDGKCNVCQTVGKFSMFDAAHP